MKILIDVSDEVGNHLSKLAQKKGWNRKQYINWQLTSHSTLIKSREVARSKKSD